MAVNFLLAHYLNAIITIALFQSVEELENGYRFMGWQSLYQYFGFVGCFLDDPHVIVVGRANRSMKEYPKRLAQAIPAEAKIIEVGNSYNERNYGQMSVAMRLEITPEFGQPYQTISVWEIEPAHAHEIRVGKTLPIKIDKQNPKVIFSNVQWGSQTYLKEYNEDDMLN